MAYIAQVYDMTAGPEDHKNRVKRAVTIRKNIDETYHVMNGANEILQLLLTDDMKEELNNAVGHSQFSSNIEKLSIDQIWANAKLKLAQWSLISL